MNKVIFFGPQGAGKGTQANLLAEHLDLPALSMGQLLREEIAAETDIGKEVKSIMDGGSLVSDETATAVLKSRLEKPDTADGYILDGYPRFMKQFETFNFDTPTHVIVIEIPEEESLKRLAGRLTCSTCGKVYRMDEGHTAGEKSVCGGELFQRDDDTPDAIKKRLEIYTNDTEPVVEAYSKIAKVHRIDGLGTVEEVSERVRALFT